MSSMGGSGRGWGGWGGVGAAVLISCGALMSGCGRGDPGPESPPWQALRGTPDTTTFTLAMVADLPEPARRFLAYSIAPGTLLARSVELEMRGELLMEPGGDPLTMTAHQILAPPAGFIWTARAQRGLLRITGYDLYHQDSGAMRWRLYGVIPVMSATGEDVTRSAAGRLAMEAVLMPAALVPGRGARWEAVDDSTARFHLAVGHETVATDLTVGADGRPTRASAMRWQGERPGGAGYSLFHVEMDGKVTAGGYTLPRRLQAGWGLGEADEFRFFDATLDRAIFR
jgi:hypothetical protein